MKANKAMGEQVRAVLTDLGWCLEPDPLGVICFYSRGNQWMVEIADGWDLCRFTDSDIRGVATPRYRTMESGDTIEEFTAALAARKLDGVKL